MSLPVVIDTDPGIDDLLALWAAFGSPLLDVRGLVSVHGNIPQSMTHRNLRGLLARAIAAPGFAVAQPGVPLVGSGARRPLVAAASTPIHDIHGDDGLGGIADRLPVPEADVPTDQPALTTYQQVLESATEPVTIIALGPLTNVALLLAARPDLADRIGRIVVMGGGDGVGNTTPAAEFNVGCDPEAAERVFGDRVPVTMVGLDVTHAVRFGRDWLDALAARGECGALAAAACVGYLERQAGHGGMALHDAVAVAAAARPDLMTVRPARVWVDHENGAGRGATFVDHREHRSGANRVPVDHVVDADVAGVVAWVADAIAALDGGR